MADFPLLQRRLTTLMPQEPLEGEEPEELLRRVPPAALATLRMMGLPLEAVKGGLAGEPHPLERAVAVTRGEVPRTDLAARWFGEPTGAAGALGRAAVETGAEFGFDPLNFPLGGAPVIAGTLSGAGGLFRRLLQRAAARTAEEKAATAVPKLTEWLAPKALAPEGLAAEAIPTTSAAAPAIPSAVQKIEETAAEAAARQAAKVAPIKGFLTENYQKAQDALQAWREASARAKTTLSAADAQTAERAKQAALAAFREYRTVATSGARAAQYNPYTKTSERGAFLFEPPELAQVKPPGPAPDFGTLLRRPPRAFEQPPLPSDIQATLGLSQDELLELGESAAPPSGPRPVPEVRAVRRPVEKLREPAMPQLEAPGGGLARVGGIPASERIEKKLAEARAFKETGKLPEPPEAPLPQPSLEPAQTFERTYGRLRLLTPVKQTGPGEEIVMVLGGKTVATGGIREATPGTYEVFFDQPLPNAVVADAARARAQEYIQRTHPHAESVVFREGEAVRGRTLTPAPTVPRPRSAAPAEGAPELEALAAELKDVLGLGDDWEVTVGMGSGQALEPAGLRPTGGFRAEEPIAELYNKTTGRVRRIPIRDLVQEPATAPVEGGVLEEVAKKAGLSRGERRRYQRVTALLQRTRGMTREEARGFVQGKNLRRLEKALSAVSEEPTPPGVGVPRTLPVEEPELGVLEREEPEALAPLLEEREARGLKQAAEVPEGELPPEELPAGGEASRPEEGEVPQELAGAEDVIEPQVIGPKLGRGGEVVEELAPMREEIARLEDQIAGARAQGREPAPALVQKVAEMRQEYATSLKRARGALPKAPAPPSGASSETLGTFPGQVGPYLRKFRETVRSITEENPEGLREIYRKAELYEGAQGFAGLKGKQAATALRQGPFREIDGAELFRKWESGEALTPAEEGARQLYNGFVDDLGHAASDRFVAQDYAKAAQFRLFKDQPRVVRQAMAAHPTAFENGRVPSGTEAGLMGLHPVTDLSEIVGRRTEILEEAVAHANLEASWPPADVLAALPENYRAAVRRLQEAARNWHSERGAFERAWATTDRFIKSVVMMNPAWHGLNVGSAFLNEVGSPSALVQAYLRGGRALAGGTADQELLEQLVKNNLHLPGVTSFAHELYNRESRQLPAVFRALGGRVLFENLITRTAAGAALERAEQLLAKYPTKPLDEIVQMAASHIDQISGQLPRVWTSEMAQRVLARVLFARDWTLSHLDIGAHALGIGPAQQSMKQWQIDAMRKMAQYHIVKGVASLLVVQNMANLLTTAFDPTDQPHLAFQNEPGHRLDVQLPWRGRQGERQYVAPVLFKWVTDLFKWVVDPAQHALNKTAPLVRAAAEQVLGREGLTGRQLPPVTEHPLTRLERIPRAMAPEFPLGGVSRKPGPYSLVEELSPFLGINVRRGAPGSLPLEKATEYSAIREFLRRKGYDVQNRNEMAEALLREGQESEARQAYRKGGGTPEGWLRLKAKVARPYETLKKRLGPKGWLEFQRTR